MNILIIGKSGQVATHLQRLDTDPRVSLTALSRIELDLATLENPTTIGSILQKNKTDAIINAAAYTAVDQAESEPEMAIAINGKAPGIIAQACKEKNIPFVHISTDFVFDGQSDRPYQENADTNPLSVYGQSKLNGEENIIASGATFAILRTAWVFSEIGKNFVKTMLALGETRNELTIVADQIGNPTPASAIANATLTIAKALTKDPTKSGIYHFAGDETTSWADFARAIFTTAGLPTNVINIPTDQYPTAAKRPAWSVLDCHHIQNTFGIPQPSWRAALNGIIPTLRNDYTA